MRDYAGLRSKLLEDLGFSSTPDGHIFSDMDPSLAARVSLANSFYKKLAPNGNNPAADLAAMDKFIAINKQVGELPLEFVACNEAESCFYDYYRDNLRVALEPHESEGSFDLDFIREHMMVGPGAAQKADSTYMVSKLFESPMSYTNDYLIPLYRAALAETGFWADAEMQRFQKFGFVKVDGGKLFFAAKNAEISRTCCTEASLNMLVQKAVGAFIEARLARHFRISLKRQPDLNRELARAGSLDGSFGTIDLVSASDSISLNLVRRDLPNGVLKTTLLASRSETAVLPDGTGVVLNMVSTMGNGFTFPLQTLIFASVVRAVYTVMGFPCQCPMSEFGVFGDDICVRREAYPFVVRMLQKLGFQVNELKSFNTGPFRESCGHDYTDGVNIRGVYVRTLETPQSVYSTLNRLARWSATHEICLPKTIGLLRSWVRDMRVPPSEADDAGIHVPFVHSIPRLTDTYWFTYRCYRRRVKRMTVAETDSDDPPINQDGVAVGYLSGHIRRRDPSFSSTGSLLNPWEQEDKWAARVTLREPIGARPRYKVVTSSIPWWDFIPDPQKVWDFTMDEWRVPLTRDTHQRWNRLMGDYLDSI